LLLKNTSIQNRFLITFFANFIRSAISFATGMLLARWLGPDDYGRMAFLLASFLAFKQFIDLSSSSAFFTFISEKQRSKKFITYFWYWVLIQFFLSISIVYIILPDNILSLLWKDESKNIVLLALIATFMQNSVWQIANQIAEAQRETYKIQVTSVLLSVVHISVITLLWLSNHLALYAIFIAIIIEWSIASFIASRWYKPFSETFSENNDHEDNISNIFSKYWIYCLPFIPYAFVSSAHDFIDRWMLQHWSGPSEQAYFSVAQQFSIISLLATTSILKIFWKEIAEANNRNNAKKIKEIYQKTTKMLFFVVAFISGLTIPWSNEVIALFLGPEYKNATITLMIMFLYPIHQSIGQIISSYFYAIKKIKVYVYLTICFLTINIIVSYFLLAPQNLIIPGLGLGSQGLALKMVMTQFISVNIMSIYIAKINQWKFEWKNQLYMISITVIFNLIIVTAIKYFLPYDKIYQIILGTFIYTLSISILIKKYPELIDLTKEEIDHYYGKFSKLFTSK
tara:strand:- start:971 stop:2506 length:1536 start_codon:yes stop_codon:yes gene_type:complete